YYLSKHDGEVQAVDLYIYISGELFSETLRRFALPLAQMQQNSEAKNAEHLADLERIQEMRQLFQSGRFREVLSSYDKLPEYQKREKVMLLMRQQAAVNVSDAELSRAIEDFRTYHADDPSVMFLSIDYFLVKQEYEKALE